MRIRYTDTVWIAKINTASTINPDGTIDNTINAVPVRCRVEKGLILKNDKYENTEFLPGLIIMTDQEFNYGDTVWEQDPSILTYPEQFGEKIRYIEYASDITGRNKLFVYYTSKVGGASGTQSHS